MTILGNTLFAGDSITVGLKPFVDVAGEKIEVAKGGQSSAALLAMIRAEETKGTLARVKNMIVLAGTNDIGSSLAPQAIFGNLQAIYRIGRDHQIRVIALTIPPAKGYAGWKGRDDEVDARRRLVNGLIMTSTLPDQVVDLDKIMQSSPGSGKLAPLFDSGDHLHPRKDKMGEALNLVVATTAQKERDNSSPNAPSPPRQNFSDSITVKNAALVTAAGVGIWRGLKWWRDRS